MQPARGRTDFLGDSFGKGDDVVLRALLDLFDACDIKGAALPDIARGLGGYNPRGRHGFGCRGFDQQPCLIPPLIAPNSPHFWVRITWNHSLAEIQPLFRNLQAVHIPKHGRGQRSVLEQISGNPLHVVHGHFLDARERLVETELPIEVDLLPCEM